LLVAGLSVSTTFPIAAQTVQEYEIGSGHDYDGIVEGTDGNLFFTEFSDNRIGIYKPDGLVTSLGTPSPTGGPDTILLGPDSNVWFSEIKANRLVRINYSDFGMSEMTIPCAISSTVVADAHALWFAEECASGEYIARMTPAGSISQYLVGTGSSRQIYTLAVGSDGNIWFTEYTGNKIGRFNTSTSSFTEFSIPTASSRSSGIVSGPDGNVWFAEYASNKLARIDLAGNITEFDWSGAMPTAMKAGSDGYLWTIDAEKQIWRVAIHAASIDRSSIPSKMQSIGASSFALGHDGNLWFTEERGSALGLIRMEGIFRDDFEGNPAP
jgi:virginiamycin B lyase